MRAWRIFDGGLSLHEWKYSARTGRLHHIIESERGTHRIALWRDDRHTDWSAA